MRITFTDHEQHPSRDAGWYFTDDLYDDSGIRYPLRISIEGPALLDFAHDVPDPIDDIVKELYREELAGLLGPPVQLKPAGSGGVNSVFFVSGDQSTQTKPDDIPVPNAYERLKAVARRMGRLAP
jgi:hypothetical protein